MSHLSRWFPCPCIDCMQRAAGPISMALASHHGSWRHRRQCLVASTSLALPPFGATVPALIQASLKLSGEMRSCRKPSPSSSQKCALGIRNLCCCFRISPEMFTYTSYKCCVYYSRYDSRYENWKTARNRQDRWQHLGTCCARSSGQRVLTISLAYSRYQRPYYKRRQYTKATKSRRKLSVSLSVFGLTPPGTSNGQVFFSCT